MDKWRRLFQFELRMLFGNRWLLGLPLVFGLLVFWNLERLPGREILFFQRSYTSLTLLHTMSLGLTMLLGVLTIRRDIRRTSYEWNGALPVSYMSRISAKYMAGVLYFTIFSVLAGAAFVWNSARMDVAFTITREFAVYYLLTFEVSYLVTLALAMLLAICIANRAVYLIAFCAWMFGTFFLDMFLLDRNKWYVLRTFHLNQLFVTGDSDAETWGIRLIADELAASRWFVLAFTLLLLTAGVLLLNRLRPTAFRRSNWVAGGLALLLAAGAFIPYLSIWGERYAGLHEKLRDPAVKTVEAIQDQKVETFQIERYDIHLQRESDDRLKIKAALQIPAGQLTGRGELLFTLNRTFHIERLAVSGSPVPFTHEGEKLTVQLSAPLTADETVQVEMEYTGKVMDYVAQNYTEGSYLAFVKGENVFLPGYVAWYPLPGDFPVYMKNSYEDSLQVAADYGGWRLPPAIFRISTSGFASKLYGNLEQKEQTREGQVFEGKSTAFVRFYSGEFEEVSNPKLPVRLVTTPYDVKTAEKLLEEWAGEYVYFAGWVNHLDPKLDQVLMLSMNNNHSLEMENKTYYLIWLVSEVEYFADQLMNSMLLGTSEGQMDILKASEDVRPQLRALMWYMYYREYKGYTADDLKQGSGGGLLYNLFDPSEDADPDHVGLRMAAQVAGALDEGKNKQVKEVLNHFYALGLEIPNQADAEGGPRPIPYDEWEREWKRVMHDAVAN
ncbi:hypothetical protein J53TS2_37300 [Paenibacillus sp. J53TS2]|uniref:ABC transporter permease n=1 Tax=Paenibacillus sp. J53TS2 TaxID=2807197 RepID=UPI001B1B20C5|nr:hypothetical protein [Paenibacillus sp. J53TS2]GIP50139.1 hypothetical protein J53TS2_37300 [Paenibacillus sp. J53TS2]